MKNKKIRKNGFTLFELLVSISIIALLTAVAVVSFGGVNKKARDSRRISDVEKVRIALESYRQTKGIYPASLNTLVTESFLEVVPSDPKTSVDYSYGSTDYTYYLCATVEVDGSMSVSQSSCNGLPDGYAGYYKAINP